MIPNHYAAKLSELDKAMVISVPPGGNWKSIPESIPSNRLKQIRESFAAGKGSRSTYYGRLHPDAPSYTINTYFSRPGNGCHIHYDYEGSQHRTISNREAARLQSFPDYFEFKGNKSEITDQIGNAVPPLMAYQIARTIPVRGQFVDLFSGCGGLSLGFLWAGWTPIVGNDIKMAFLETYRLNIHDNIVCGDIRDTSVFEEIVSRTQHARKSQPSMPLLVLGGPPCQGFSTAGNKRSMSDDRNWLFRQYKAILECIKPDGFVFENVPGLLNMEGGTVFEMIRSELKSTTKDLSFWKLCSEEYGIPQRRTRIILFGDSTGEIKCQTPNPLTQWKQQGPLFSNLPKSITVKEALSDLPPIIEGEDGSEKNYLQPPVHPYQAFMRSEITVEEYISWLRSYDQ